MYPRKFCQNCKLILVVWLSFFCLFPTKSIFSQTLTEQVGIIQQDYDLMGGVVIVFCEEQVLESIPFGTADLQRNIPVTDTSVFRIASISKSITALALLRLYEDGLVDLDADINDLLSYSVRNPNFANEPITLRMLLSHTSSIIDGSTYSSFLSATYNNNPIPDLSELLTPQGSYYSASLFNTTLPGSYFNYSNLNYGIIGTIIEKVSGLRFDVYCKQYIFDPLEINASYNVNDLNDINDVAVLYRKINEQWIPQADNYQGIQPTFTNLDGYINGTNGLRFAPQGGLRISGIDLAKIFSLLLNEGNYLGQQYFESTTIIDMYRTEWLYDGNNGNNYGGLFRSWGLGIHKTTNTPNNDIVLSGSQQMLGHPGEAYGLISDAYIDLDRKVGLVFITNGSGTGYSIGGSSAFYTVEKDLFDAIETSVDINDCTSLDIADLHDDDTTIIYPNPAYDWFQINGNLNIKKIKIYSSFGKLLKVHSRKDRYPISDLINGLYFIEVVTQNDSSINKFIKN